MVVSPLPPGTRVRHYGQQYPRAEGGTATVLEAVPQHDGTFEYRVQTDASHDLTRESRETWWASYDTVLPTNREGVKHGRG